MDNIQLPASIRKKIPKFPEDELLLLKKADPVVYALFTNGKRDWYVLEGEPQSGGDFLFYGLITGEPTMFGMFTLSELAKCKAKLNDKFRSVAFSKLATKKKWEGLKP